MGELDRRLYEGLAGDVEAISQRQVFLVRVQALARQIEGRVRQVRDSAATGQPGRAAEGPPAQQWAGENNVW